MAYYFQAKQLCVGYQNQPLIQNIEIELKKGEILTLIGPNGAGKSTILKSIARQLELLGGSVLLEDKNLQSLSGRELAKKMAVVFTKRPHTELMTCEDVVATGRYPYTGRFGVLSAKDHEAVQEAMEAVHVLEFKDRDFARISDGQRQRILLARAICQEPEIIVLDEPTSFLDIRHKLELLSILRSMAKEKGITVIMSLHEIDLAQKLADRQVVVLPTRTVPMGITALLNFDPSANVETNTINMMAAADKVSTGLITYAARDSEFDGKRIRKGEIMALENGKIVATSNDLTKATYRLARGMCKKDSSFVTIISGCDVSDEDAEKVTEIVKAKCPNHVEVSHIRGGQPVYYYMISVE